VSQPFNPTIHGGSYQITKILTHKKVNKVEFTIFNSDELSL